MEDARQRLVDCYAINKNVPDTDVALHSHNALSRKRKREDHSIHADDDSLNPPKTLHQTMDDSPHTSSRRGSRHSACLIAATSDNVHYKTSYPQRQNPAAHTTLDGYDHLRNGSSGDPNPHKPTTRDDRNEGIWSEDTFQANKPKGEYSQMHNAPYERAHPAITPTQGSTPSQSGCSALSTRKVDCEARFTFFSPVLLRPPPAMESPFRTMTPPIIRAAPPAILGSRASPPPNGYEMTHIDHPHAQTRGLSRFKTQRIANSPFETTIRFQVAGYSYHSHEHSVDAMRYIKAVFFDHDLTLRDVDIDPPTPEEGDVPTGVNAPTLWGAYNLPPKLVQKMTMQQVISYDAITLFPRPNYDPPVTHLGNVIGLEISALYHDLIVETVMDTIRAPNVRIVVERFLGPGGRGERKPFEEWVSTVTPRVRWSRDDKHSYYVSVFGIAPTRHQKEFDQEWTVFWRSLTFGKNGRIASNPIRCNICHSSDHHAEHCYYPSSVGWKGPNSTDAILFRGSNPVTDTENAAAN